MVSLNDVVTALTALSSLAVISGAVFIVIQLRQNAQLLGATLQQNRADASISLLERITDELFPSRRARMHEIMKRFRETNWKDAFETPDDFEIRNFAYIYELIGLMVKHGLIDREIVLDTLQNLVVRDCQVYEPHAKFVTEKYGVRLHAYGNFGWLANEVVRHFEARARAEAPAGS